ncbi:GNAT family N-acetyltransferase [Serpentinicella alkaliphila]|uniref:Acetyltransferase (GNAT) family protein n=1 Tax=Serpentinicella alkaliphila TaxID=1734049 RepID=A0A4R2T9R3_9FIRM|nr:GNAT family N-acetyltransferase [Serpentinicella alkaliphila]QUH26107.1 GNAT family N-acetyltransferase [Serpentinicella alkaliphila]TCP98446.1 acetyltransferase (GNAT) family protein [Serpentinicella alkaliphila]
MSFPSSEFYINRNTYLIRELSIYDEQKIQNLCERCLDYFELVEGTHPEECEGRNILYDLPPNKSLEDKFVFGVFDNMDRLVAVADIIKDYKAISEWIIGLMLIDPRERGLGLGRKVYDMIKEWISRSGGKAIRIGVVENNINGYNFWFSLGLREIQRVEMKFKLKEHIVIIMNTNLEKC